MGLLDEFVALIAPYSLWLVLIVLVLAGFAVFKSSLAGGTTAGIFVLGILFILAGVWLVLTGFTDWAVLLFILGVFVFLIDAWHEKRVTRRGYARMKG
jgi:hypothetical protein